MKIALYILSILISGYVYYKHVMKDEIQMNSIGSMFLLVNMFIPVSNLAIAYACIVGVR